MKITNEERAVLAFYQKQVKAAQDAGKVPSDCKVVWSSLRMESTALATQSAISFAMNVNDQSIPASPTEIRLQQVDTFVMTRVSVLLMRRPAGVQNNQSRLYTFPNPNVFTAAGEATALESVYNGLLNIMVNRNLYTPQLDTRQFYRVPIAQEGTATAGALPAGMVSAGYTRDAWGDADWAFIEGIPTIAFFGGKTNQIEIDLRQSAAMAAAGGAANFAVVFMRGFLLQNFNSDQMNVSFSK